MHVKRVVGEGVQVCPVPGSKGVALDLFFGTGSVGAQLKKHVYSVVSLVFQRSAKANFTVEILEWDYKKAFEPRHFALIAAGVPCTEYSVALTTRARNLEHADKIVKKKHWKLSPISGRKGGGSRIQGLVC